MQEDHCPTDHHQGVHHQRHQDLHGIGGSGNTIIHVPAVATESGIEMNFSDIYAAASFEIPLLVGVRPNGPYNMDQYAKPAAPRPFSTSLKC